MIKQEMIQKLVFYLYKKREGKSGIINENFEDELN